MATHTSKTKFGIVKIILFILILIIVVQIITLAHFSSRESFDERNRREHFHEKDFVYEITTKLPPQRNLWRPVNKSKEDDFSIGQFSTGFLASPIRCKVSHKDAKSALERVKTESCRNQLYEAICLGQEEKLYWKNITRFCPVSREKGRPSHAIEPKEGYGPPIRILFAMVVHGRAIRQTKRLFKALFHKDHYFFIHVDSRSDYMYKEVLELSKEFDNVALTDWRMATIWGGASLLQMLLRMMADVLAIKSWKWDFFLNLSAACYPVQNNENLSAFLRAHRNENFLRPHGGKTERFVKKQGLSRTFYECDEHMWRLGERKLPNSIDFDGGSDWICLNREFVDYVVNSQDTLVLGLKQIYKYTLLPAESFFHSVLRNSRYCQTFAKGNLRLTNWKRKLGCRCQYKHIVDWCGCSPNDFKPEDFVRLQSQTNNFFARKFEAIVNQEIINKLDEWLYGKPINAITARDSYWENFYHSSHDNGTKFDVTLTFLQSFSRMTAKSMCSEDCQFIPIWRPKEATLLTYNDTLKGVLSLFKMKIKGDGDHRELVDVETYFKPKCFMETFNSNMSEPTNRLKSLSLGTGWDQKERIFRNIAGFIGPNDDPVLVHRWVHGTQFYARIVWIDPLNVIAGMYQMEVEKKWVISYHKPTFTKPLRPGTWTVKITYNDDVTLGSIKFLVIPKAFFNGKETTLENAIATNNGPPAGLYSPDFIIEFDRNANNTKALVKEFGEKSHSTGSSLDSWIDEMVAKHWDFKGACITTQMQQNKCCASLPLCKATDWSSKSPDPKSEIGEINSEGHLRIF